MVDAIVRNVSGRLSDVRPRGAGCYIVRVKSLVQRGYCVRKQVFVDPHDPIPSVRRQLRRVESNVFNPYDVSVRRRVCSAGSANRVVGEQRTNEKSNGREGKREPYFPARPDDLGVRHDL